MTAQVWFPPAEIAATPDVKPVTSTGVDETDVVPLPSCPLSFTPQHLTPPGFSSAQVWLEPADTATTPDVNPVTSTGRAEGDVVVVPFPNFPAFPPQHTAPPAVVTPHVWPLPALMEPAMVCTGAAPAAP